MAKVTARGMRLVQEWTTEREENHPRPIYLKGEDGSLVYTPDGRLIQSGEENEHTLTREKWQLRSDNAILHRVIWQQISGRDYYGKDGRLDFSSGYAIRFKLTPESAPDAFTAWLTKRGYRIV